MVLSSSAKSSTHIVAVQSACIYSSTLLADQENFVEQVRGIFYTTQDTLLLTYRRGESLLVVEGKREADDHIG